MSEKSELEYLLEAADTTVNAVQLRAVVRRAIERRKQDLAKADAALLYTNREKLYMDTPQNVPNTADNTPKGGGDVSRYIVDELKARNGFSPLTPVVKATDYDALLAERDALSAHDSQCIKDRVSFCEEIEELEAMVERLTAERDAARTENLRLEAEVDRLQAALAFWMPGVPADDAEIATRAGDDAWLLAGMDGNEPSAESRGWIVLRNRKADDAARAELKEALDLLRKNVQLGMTPLICAPTLHDDVSNFLDRVGKQP